MRVLVLTPWPIFPLSHGGRVRAFRLASGLVRRGAAVDIVCPWSPGQPRGVHAESGVRIRPQRFAILPFLKLPDYRLPSAIPLAWEARLPRARSLVAAAGEYDVVQIDSSGFAPWLERLPAGVRRVYGSHNVEADFARGRAATGGRMARRLADRIAELERRGVTASDLVLACTERDAVRFGELSDPAACAVIPNGYDDGLLSLDRAGLREKARAELGIAADERVLLFVGGGADHNLRAVAFLEEQVVPRLDATAQLLVAGKAAEALTGRTNRARGLGFVADMDPLLAAADVALNPVPYGSGSNLKVAEYLACGLPVVTTPIGARGFERWQDRLRIVELADFVEGIEQAPPPGAAPPGIDELAWSRIAETLYALYSGR